MHLWVKVVFCAGWISPLHTIALCAVYTVYHLFKLSKHDWLKVSNRLADAFIANTTMKMRASRESSDIQILKRLANPCEERFITAFPTPTQTDNSFWVSGASLAG